MNSLRTRLIVLFVLFTLVPACLVTGVSTYMNAVEIKKSAGEDGLLVTGQIANQIDRLMTDSKGMVEALAVAPAPMALDPAGTKDLILAVQQRNPKFELIFVMDAAGMQFARTSGNLANRADRAYFKEAMKGETYITDAYTSSFTSEPTVTIASPIKDKAGTIIGVMAADVSLKAISEFVGKTVIGKTGYVDVVDGKGRLLVHPDKQKMIESPDISSLEYVAKVSKGEAGVINAASSKGVESIIAYSPVSLYKWGIIAYEPVSEVNGIIFAGIGVTAGLLLLITLLAIAAAFYISRGMARPLQVLAQAAERLATGDLTGRIAVDGVVEMNQLAQALQHIQIGFKNMISSIVTSSEQMAASSEQLTASAEQSSQAAELVADSITDVAEGADKQRISVEQAAQIVQEISNNISQISQYADTASATAGQTADAAKIGGEDVAKAVSQMGAIETTVGSSAQVVAKLGERSKEIGQIVDTISGIAAQTNLLALNAAIEAARAGEQGRGFAVVAEEVRKLAEQSQEAAKKIAEMISEIQSETNMAVQAMDQGLRETQAGAGVVNHAGQSFQQIADLVSTMSGQVREISESIRRVAAGSTEIVRTVHAIGDVSKEVASQTQTVSAATEEQSASMQEIASSSEALSAMAADLQATVAKFKL